MQGSFTSYIFLSKNDSVSESENRLYDLTSKRVPRVSDSNTSEARQVISVTEVGKCEHKELLVLTVCGPFKGRSHYQALVFRALDLTISQEMLTV